MRALAMLVLVISLLASGGILIFQCIDWLRTAKWNPISLNDGLVFLHLPISPPSWLGIRLILTWVIGLPLALCLPAIGFAMGSFVTSVSRQFLERAKK